MKFIKVNLKELISMTKAKESGEGWYLGHCPGHDDKHPSFTFREGSRGDGVFYQCKAGCDESLIKNELSSITTKNESMKQNLEEVVQKIWDEAIPLGDGRAKLGIKYLNEIRGIHLEKLPSSIRYHSNLLTKNSLTDKWENHPGLVFKVQNNDGHIKAVHRVMLGPDGNKIPGGNAKKALGDLTGNGIFLGNPSDTVFECEGPENALAIYAATGTFTVSRISASTMKNAIPVNGVKNVIISIDLDQNGVGQRAGEELARKYKEKYPEISVSIADTGRIGVDFADVYANEGPYEVLSLLDNARSFKTMPFEPQYPSSLIRASDIIPVQPEFLVYPYIPRAAVTLIGGDGGTGKSFCSLAIAAAASIGADIPGIGKFQQCESVIFNMEDGAAEVQGNRILGLEGDFSKIHIFDNSKDLPDLEKLREFVAPINPGLIIIDPVQAFMSDKVDMNRANQIRAFMVKFMVFAKSTNAAVLIICHHTKDQSRSPLYRIIGSIDFISAARSVLAAAKIHGTPLVGLFHTKSNYAPMGDSFTFRIEGGKFEWGGQTDITMEEAFNLQGGGFPTMTGPSASSSGIEEAKEILDDLLKNGPIAATEVYRVASQEKISPATLRRAKSAMGVISQRRGITEKQGGGFFLWGFPNQFKGCGEHQDIEQEPDENGEEFHGVTDFDSFHAQDEVDGDEHQN